MWTKKINGGALKTHGINTFQSTYGLTDHLNITFFLIKSSN